MGVERRLILALETAVEGGSVSIWDQRRRTEVGGVIGKTGVSKAEDVLENVGMLIEKHSIEKADFDLVVSATGVGSATGLKIGEATAKGLARSLGCRYREISLWEALAAVAIEKNSPAKIKAIYLPAGKGRIVGLRLHELRFVGDAEINTAGEICSSMRNSAESDYYVHEGLLKEIGDCSGTILISSNLAGYLNEFASDNEVKLD